MSNPNHAPVPGSAGGDELDRIRPGDPGVRYLGKFTIEELHEMGLSCETWEKQKRFDRRLAEERAGRAAA